MNTQVRAEAIRRPNGLIMTIPLLLSLLLIGCTQPDAETDSTAESNTPSATSTETSTPNSDQSSEDSAAANDADGNGITLAAVAERNTADDCWLVIDGEVYDVTEYIRRHPGGNAIVDGCGTDATAMFNQRPQDNRSHSASARAQLPNYRIGTLAE